MSAEKRGGPLICLAWQCVVDSTGAMRLESVEHLVWAQQRAVATQVLKSAAELQPVISAPIFCVKWKKCGFHGPWKQPNVSGPTSEKMERECTVASAVELSLPGAPAFP